MRNLFGEKICYEAPRGRVASEKISKSKLILYDCDILVRNPDWTVHKSVLANLSHRPYVMISWSTITPQSHLTSPHLRATGEQTLPLSHSMIQYYLSLSSVALPWWVHVQLFNVIKPASFSCRVTVTVVTTSSIFVPGHWAPGLIGICLSHEIHLGLLHHQ